MPPVIDLTYLKQWEQKSDAVSDTVTAWPIAALAATLDNDALITRTPKNLPPCWHWLFCLPATPQSELGPDGHPARGGFLPPVPLPRRMWAGSRLSFLSPVKVGSEITRKSTVVSVDTKQGRTGPLVFVLARHEIWAGDTMAIVEEHDIVYRDMPAPDAAAPKSVACPADATWERTITPTDTLLFRYSALTFNGHRIHYSRDYVTEVEGYPGLVVHGPLIATLLLDLIARKCPGATVTSFSFRAVSPLFEIHPFYVCGKPVNGTNEITLWARNHEGHLAMEARAVLLK